MIVIKENFCDIVGNKSNSYLAQMIHQMKSVSNSNFYEPCPLMVCFKREKPLRTIIFIIFPLQGRRYRYQNLIGAKAFPPLMPIGEWKLITKLVTYMNGVKELLLTFVDVYEINQKTAIQF